MAKRLIAKFGPVGPHNAVARVYRDNEWDEYVVTIRCDGVLVPGSSYHTTDRKDACGTACVMIRDPRYCRR